MTALRPGGTAAVAHEQHARVLDHAVGVEQHRADHAHARPLDLTLHEYRLLETLLSQPERVFTRGQLLERGWDDPDHRLERTIDSHIKSLRNKLRRIKPDADPICTHRGVGYSLIPDA